MSTESSADLDGMRVVGQITRHALDILESHVRVGVSTADLDAIAWAVFASHGARSAPALVYGFPGNVLISVNDEVVHGVPGPRRLQRDDLVKLDVTLEKNGYVADAARSVVVGFGTPPGVLIACARAAFRAAVAVAQAGTAVNEIGRAVAREVHRRRVQRRAGTFRSRRWPNHPRGTPHCRIGMTRGNATCSQKASY